MSQCLKHRKEQLIKKNGCVCARCQEEFSFEKLTVHHVLPRSITSGIRNLPENSMLLCRECHDEVHSTLHPSADLWCYIQNQLASILADQRKPEKLNSFVSSIYQATLVL